MGSLSSLAGTPRTAQEFSPESYRIYVSACTKDPSINLTMENWIESYDLSSNSWHRITRIPGVENHVIKDFSLVSINDSIYVIGGRLCSKIMGDYQNDQFDEIELEVMSSVLRYNIITGSWSKCAPLITARYDFACAVGDGKIFVAGGQCTLGSAKGISLAEIYDPGLDEWKPLPKMSTLRYKCAGVTWQGKFHVVGGFLGSEDGDSRGPFIVDRSSAEVYDTHMAAWHLKARMWELDVPPNQIVAVDGKLFSSGDCYKIWKGHIDAYDEKLSIWNIVEGSYLNTLSSPISMSSATADKWPPLELVYLTMAPIGNHLYFLAGYRKPEEISRMRSVVHVFDTSADGGGWRSFEPNEVDGEKELCGHCCVVKLEH